MERSWSSVLLVLAGLLMLYGLSSVGEAAVWAWRVGFVLLIVLGVRWLYLRFADS